jgi:hypothetical protein
MRRAFLLVAFYALAGTAITLVVYRLVLGGPLHPAGDRTLDSLMIFFSVTMNMLLAFAAAGVAAVMVRGAQPGFLLPAGISAVIAGAVGIGMMFWFVGLRWYFALTMVVAALVCAAVAAALGWLGLGNGRPTP